MKAQVMARSFWSEYVGGLPLYENKHIDWKKNTAMVAIQISVTRGNGLRPLVIYKWICTYMGSNLKEIEMYYRAQWKGGYCKWVTTPV